MTGFCCVVVGIAFGGAVVVITGGTLLDDSRAVLVCGMIGIVDCAFGVDGGTFGVIGGGDGFGGTVVSVGVAKVIAGTRLSEDCAIVVNVVALDAMTETGDGLLGFGDSTINGVGELADFVGFRIGKFIPLGDNACWKNLSMQRNAVLNRVIGDARAFAPGSVCML
jgi:hypothetical protein